jgi:hypothetical protein
MGRRPRPIDTAGARLRRAGALALCAGSLMLAGCAPAMNGAEPQETADPALALAMAEATAPKSPQHIIFDWTLRERDARFSGRGAARVAPAYRARLDLFGPRGEGYMSAVLIGTDLQLGRAADASGELPPPELLWTVLGTFHPPERAVLLSTRQQGTVLRLEYGLDGQRWRFRFEDGRLRHAEWDAGRAGRRTVELRGETTGGLPREALYRDWIEFRELNLTLDQVHDVDDFPPDTWTIGY